MPSPGPINQVNDARWVRAVSHPLRMRALALLENEPASPKMLSERLGVSIGTISYHVRVLHKLGLVDLDSTRQRRGAIEHYYRTAKHTVVTDEAWADLDTVSKQRILASMLAQANEHAVQAAAAGGFDAADAHFTRTPLRLDTQGWTKLAEASKRWLDEAAAIQQESTDRLSDDDAAPVEVPTELVILLFESFAGQARDQEHLKGGRVTPAARTQS